MPDAISNLYKKYKLNEDQTNEIYAQNRRVLKGIYLFSFFFGLTFLIVALVSASNKLQTGVITGRMCL